MRVFLAESIGTFVMVLCGTGAMILHDETDGSVTHFMVAISFGLSVFAMIYVFGKTSGAHINPAVTIAFSLSGLFDKKEIPKYVVAQIFGALLASFFLFLCFPQHPTLGATIPSGSWYESFIWEFFLSFVLMYTILWFSQHQSHRKHTAIAVGFVVFLEAYFIGPITGASMNPARSIGPAIFSGQMEDLWIYILSTILGMIVACLIWNQMRKRKLIRFSIKNQ